MTCKRRLADAAITTRLENPVAKRKKKQLPKDFESLLEKRDVEELKILFDTCDINARGGFYKQIALAFHQCPDELARWLVERGADLAAVDRFGDTPLHSRSRHWNGRIEVLLELGADVNHGEGENLQGTPLHAAAGAYQVATAGLLLRHGAHVDARNRERQTPLEYALQRCSNMNIEDMAALAELLLAAGARKTPAMKAFVARIGSDFEFHRSNFNPDFLDATSAALDRLYVLFEVPPAPRRILHDGKSPIALRSARWEDQHRELWELLVPSSGAARTVQGEVVRIAGRIHDELERNGGINWDREYKRMADAFLVHLSSGKPLAESLLIEAREIVAKIKRKNGDTRRLCELGVNWVALNPKPLKLPTPDYNR
jgi:ankyrin repeat protein